MGTTSISIDEIYFLVRVGTWDQQKLADYIDQRVNEALEDQAFDLTQESNHSYESGYESGRHAGWVDGKEHGYDEGYSRGHSEGYSEGMRDGERNVNYRDDRW